MRVLCLAIGLLMAALADVASAQTTAINPGVPWPATDGLGRSLPMAEEVGPPRPERFVGVFYFLWHGRHGEAGPFDVTRILAQDPGAITNASSPLWGPMYAPHHWGEPLFGYYVSDDRSVLRKHAQMLADAGVDAIIFDVSNQLTYPESWQPLCEVFDQVLKVGGRVPRIAFLCPFWEPRKVVRELYDQLYSKGLYSHLWFQWNGKPLIMADPALLGSSTRFGSHKTPTRLEPGHTLGQSFTSDKPFSSVGGEMPTWSSRTSSVTMTLFLDGPQGERLLSRRFESVTDNGWVELASEKPFKPGKYYLEASLPDGPVGWWSDAETAPAGGMAFSDGRPVDGRRVVKIAFADEMDAKILDTFTFRKPQPDYFVGPTGPNQWGWLEVSSQHVFTNASGAAEQMTVGISQNALEGKLGVASHPQSHGRSFHDGAEPSSEGRDYFGRNFQDQWQRALSVNPNFVFITGWNEWVAGRMDNRQPFHGAGPVAFVDEFNEEFSRDIEPMKGGHEDAYYYQMIANIRRYKGVETVPSIQSRPIVIDGHFEDWDQVSPEFLDTPGDPVRRNYRGWSASTRYVNCTGRNDIFCSKVSMDSTNVYFYVRTRETLTPCTDSNWMLLFIDADRDAKTGWLGYDFAVNRTNVRTGVTTLERNVGGYHWGTPTDVPMRVDGNQLELAIPRTALGLNRLPATLDFKWADNIQQTGEASDFTVNGDVAPNDRYNFRAHFSK